MCCCEQPNHILCEVNKLSALKSSIVQCLAKILCSVLFLAKKVMFVWNGNWLTDSYSVLDLWRLWGYEGGGEFYHIDGCFLASFSLCSDSQPFVFTIHTLYVNNAVGTSSTPSPNVVASRSTYAQIILFSILGRCGCIWLTSRLKSKSVLTKLICHLQCNVWLFWISVMHVHVLYLVLSWVWRTLIALPQRWCRFLYY